jgi:hypothetical protein
MVIDEVCKLMNLKRPNTKKIEQFLQYYGDNHFDIVVLAKNQKIPIEKDWLNKEHRDITDWKNWLDCGLNIGVKTGQKSSITVIDIDTGEIPESIQKVLGTPIIQRTKQGWHLFYKYVDLPTTRIDDLKIDILNDGKQCVVYPSVVEGIERDFQGEFILTEMPTALKTLLEEKLSVPVRTFSEKMAEEIQSGDFSFDLIKEGNRHNIFMHLGGILRKELNIAQTENVLRIFNSHFCNPRLDQRDFTAIVKSLDRYDVFDDRELASKVLNYLRVVEETSARDVKDALGEKKERIDKVLSYLVKEGYIIKKSRGIFQVLKKAEWKEVLIEEDKRINWKMPYFYDKAIFRYGDMIIIGGTPKVGKTHIAMNIAKQFVNQGITPYYVSLESGNRFISIALTLGLKPGDFKWCIHFNPQQIELEKNAVTIIDWLLPNDYSETDKLFKHFAEQLVKNGGILIVFVQLKYDGKFFAENMISMFPALITRYLYDAEHEGESGHFTLDYIREPLEKKKREKIPCRYLFETKELKRVDEDEEINSI